MQTLLNYVTLYPMKFWVWDMAKVMMSTKVRKEIYFSRKKIIYFFCKIDLSFFS